MLSTLVRPAWRSLRRTPAFTVTATLTLVIGIAASVAIFALVNGVLLRPLPYGDPDRLVGVWNSMPAVGINKANQPVGFYRTYEKLARSIESIGLYQTDAVNVSDPRGGAEPQRLRGASVTRSVLPTLKVSPLLGRNFTEEEDRPNGPKVMIISEGLWRSRFGGDRGAIGKTLLINGSEWQVIGIMPKSFRFPDARSQFWLPMRLDPAEKFPGGFNNEAVARLKPGVTIEAASRDFKAVLPRVLEISPNFAPGVSTKMVLDQAKPVPFVSPLKEDVVGGIAKTLWVVAAAAGLVLLVACANVTNLMLVRADGRQRELAVREALGAGRGRVLAHFFAESVLLSTVATALSVGVAALAIRALVAFGPQETPRLGELRVDGTTVGFAVALAVLVALVCSVAPALRIGRVQLSHALREGGRSGTAGKARQRVRGALVAAQIALALVALAGSGLLVRTFLRINAVKPGFDPSNVATFWLSLGGNRYKNDTTVVRFYAGLLDRVRALPGVRDASVGSHLPLLGNGMNQDPVYPEGDASYANKIPPLAVYSTVDGAYFRTMGIPLVAGRAFEPLERQRAGEAIISTSAAWDYWKDSTGRSVIGKRFRELPGAQTFTVVGVVGSVRDTALAGDAARTIYVPQAPAADEMLNKTRWTMGLVVRTAGDPASITRTVERAVHDLDPSLPVFQVSTMTAVVEASMAQLTFTIIVLGVAAFATLALGAIGLYGVMAYAVALRTRELGVRIALGATPGRVVGMLTRQGVALTGVGVAAGLGLFALVARFLRTMLFGVAPTDPVTLAGSSLLLVAIAALASWIPARRTTRLDPSEVLRSE
ncbi:MAG: ABC transporter permease [Gemmatimonadaceae bacterium]